MTDLATMAVLVLVVCGMATVAMISAMLYVITRKTTARQAFDPNKETPPDGWKDCRACGWMISPLHRGKCPICGEAQP
jgi:rubrerythrin